MIPSNPLQAQPLLQIKRPQTQSKKQQPQRQPLTLFDILKKFKTKWIIIGCVFCVLAGGLFVGIYLGATSGTRRYDTHQSLDTTTIHPFFTSISPQDGSASTLYTPTPIMRMILSTPQINEITSYINNIRTKHNSPPLTYDPELSIMAQEWADILALDNGSNIRHSDNTNNYGENIHYRFNVSCSDNKVALINGAIDSWYNEEKDFNYNQPEDSLRNTNTVKVGHFTCLVWKASTRYGIGFVCENSKLYVVMNTSPKPNTIDTIRDNVSRPTSS